MCFSRQRVHMFTPEEDSEFIDLMDENPKLSWKEISTKLVGHTPRQCRDHWLTQLSPLLKLEEWSRQEKDHLVEKVEEIGEKWDVIKTFFPKRSISDLKTQLRKAMIDKVHHSQTCRKYTLEKEEIKKTYFEASESIDESTEFDRADSYSDTVEAQKLSSSFEKEDFFDFKSLWDEKNLTLLLPKVHDTFDQQTDFLFE